MGPLKKWKKKTIYNMTLSYFTTKFLSLACLFGLMVLINAFLDGKFFLHFNSYFQLHFKVSMGQNESTVIAGK